MSTPGELLEALGREARARFGGGGGPTRVYRGRSVEELVPQIQRELGAEAIIVRRREGLTGGVLGFFQHPFVEIEAMPGGPGVDVYDEPLHAQPSESAPPAAAASSAQVAAGEPPVAFAPAPSAPEPAPTLAPAVPAAPAVPPASEQYGAPDYSAPGLGAASQPPVEGRAAPSVRPIPSGPYLSRAAPTARASAPPAFALPAAPLVPPAAPGVSAQPPLAPPSAPGASTPPPIAPAPASSPPPIASAPASTPPPLAPPVRPTPEPPSSTSKQRHGEPSPFFARQPPEPPPAGAGNAYVTAHLAALARTSRSKNPPPPQTPERQADPVAWSSDFQELEPSDVPELFPPPLERVAPAPVRTPAERRVVAAGSHARARAGVAKSLQRYGISEELATELIDSASAHALALAPRAGMAQAVRMTLAQRIPVASALPSTGAAIVVVGAGGAGKTTCCAALLGAYRKSSSLPASFATITRENERAELRMLLSPYIMRPTPARTPRALRALRRARGDGVAVLDTPSLSPSDRAGIRELAGLLAELEPERVVVALPATLGPAAAAQLLQALRPLGATSLAVTHADETDQIGVAVEAACRFAIAPEYVLDRGRGGAWRLSRVDPAGLAARLLQ